MTQVSPLYMGPRGGGVGIGCRGRWWGRPARGNVGTRAGVGTGRRFQAQDARSLGLCSDTSEF